MRHSIRRGSLSSCRRNSSQYRIFRRNNDADARLMKHWKIRKNQYPRAPILKFGLSNGHINIQQNSEAVRFENLSLLQRVRIYSQSTVNYDLLAKEKVEAIRCYMRRTYSFRIHRSCMVFWSTKPIIQSDDQGLTRSGHAAG